MIKLNMCLTILLIIMVGCEKEPILDPESGGISYYEEKEIHVNIEAPYNEQTFDYNEELKINGAVSANFLLHGFHVRLFNQTNSDSLLFESYVHDHGDVLEFSESWINNLPHDSQIRIEVSGFGNHYQGALIETQTVVVNCYAL